MGRHKTQKAGDYMRRALEPMALRLGVDYDTAFWSSPTTEPALAFEVYRCGLSLLMAYTYDDGWGVSSGEATSRRLAKKAAKVMRQALHEESGREAISHMAQGYARETAGLWRRAADNGEDPNGDPLTSDQQAILRLNADSSAALGDLASRHWPVADESEVLPKLREAEQHRFFRVDNPDQKIDVRTAAARTQAATEAAALAIGPAFDEFASLLLGPVMNLNLELALGLAADWDNQADHWTNLMCEVPLSFYELLQVNALAQTQTSP